MTDNELIILASVVSIYLGTCILSAWLYCCYSGNQYEQEERRKKKEKKRK